jgi:hypothetical protein
VVLFLLLIQKFIHRFCEQYMYNYEPYKGSLDNLISINLYLDDVWVKIKVLKDGM